MQTKLENIEQVVVEIKDMLVEADKKYAAKWVEKAFYALVMAVLVSVLAAVVSGVLTAPTKEVVGQVKGVMLKK